MTPLVPILTAQEKVRRKAYFLAAVPKPGDGWACTHGSAASGVFMLSSMPIWVRNVALSLSAKMPFQWQFSQKLLRPKTSAPLLNARPSALPGPAAFTRRTTLRSA